MRKLLATLGLVAAATVGVTVASTATATTPALALCSGWYVNPDETSRAPEQLSDGLKFESTDLIHHVVANLPVASLLPGSYAATPAPDQPSFFSVEVRNPSGAYGTLRWNPSAVMWQITIGAGTGPGGPATDGTFSGADPAALLAGKVTKWGAFAAGTDVVVSFGVGYTANPPSTVATKVTSITFQGQASLTYCLPPASSPAASSSSSSSKPASATATATVSASSSASASASTSASATPSSTPIVTRPVGGLPLTGAPLIAIGGVGVALVLLGGVALWLLKRRDDQFDSQEQA